MQSERPERPRGAAALPTGTVTFLFTDIEGSTRLVQALGERYPALLADHRRLIEQAVAGSGGHVFGAEGDALFAAFDQAPSAVSAAVSAQQALAAHAWPDGVELRVRMGLHTGEAVLVGDDYVGLTLHQVARMAAAAHGGQILLSATTRALAAGALPEGLGIRDLGEHRLKDLARSERLYQLVVPGLPSAFPPPRTLDVRPHNLPVQLTSFVGREDLAEARRLLDAARLLTLTGPGGTGKTRLALQLAAEAAESFADGTFFVGLDAVTDPELLASVIATALGRIEAGDAPPVERLVDHLRDLRLLLVLDNFEQIVGAAPTVARLLREAPEIRIVVTSRIALRVSGEQEFAVPPLGLPAVDDAVTAERAAASEAVRLFVERSMAVRPGFRLTDGNAAAVADIVARLDGLPLAIELAAARVRVLPVEALRDRLDRSLAVLVGGARDLPERQQTLRGAIDWSHDLLDGPDRRTFAHFGVFAGGAHLAQAETVCGSVEAPAPDVLEGLESLVEKSLLRTVPTDDGSPRFAMLATIREYALDRLEERGGSDAVRRRHAEAYLALAEDCSVELTGPRSGPWLDRLELEHDNLRAALDWAVGRGEAGIALRMGAALWRFWQIRGHLNEARDRLDRILAVPGAEDASPEVRAAALRAAGSIGYWRGDQDAAHRHYAAALVEARRSGDPAAIAGALYDLAFAPTPGVVTFTTGPESAGYIEEALRIYRELGDDRGIANASWALGTGRLGLRDLVAARRHFEEALPIYERLGDAFGAGWAHHELGLLEIHAGDTDAAARHLSAALDRFLPSDDQSALVVLLLDVALLAEQRGQTIAAARLSGAGHALRIRSGADLVLASGPMFGFSPPERPTDDARAAEAWDEGSALPIEDAIAEALAQLGR